MGRKRADFGLSVLAAKSKRTQRAERRLCHLGCP
jgi:hypothetical protein